MVGYAPCLIFTTQKINRTAIGDGISIALYTMAGVQSSALKNQEFEEFWDADTEFLVEHDPTFPKSVLEKEQLLLGCDR